MGILNGDDYQIVYSDTPGILEPRYSLHEAMMSYVKVSLDDADIILLVTELEDTFDEALFGRFRKMEKPILLLVNKADLGKGSQASDKAQYWKEMLPNARKVMPVSAKTGLHVDEILEIVKEYLPVHPPFFRKTNSPIDPSVFLLPKLSGKKFFSTTSRRFLTAARSPSIRSRTKKIFCGSAPRSTWSAIPKRELSSARRVHP
jgi:GTP-binding protein Era